MEDRRYGQRGYREHEKERPGKTKEPSRSGAPDREGDRKSTRLNSSHANISYAVFCWKKKIHMLTRSMPHPIVESPRDALRPSRFNLRGQHITELTIQSTQYCSSDHGRPSSK